MCVWALFHLSSYFVYCCQQIKHQLYCFTSAAHLPLTLKMVLNVWIKEPRLSQLQIACIYDAFDPTHRSHSRRRWWTSASAVLRQAWVRRHWFEQVDVQPRCSSLRLGWGWTDRQCGGHHPHFSGWIDGECALHLSGTAGHLLLHSLWMWPKRGSPGSSTHMLDRKVKKNRGKGRGRCTDDGKRRYMEENTRVGYRGQGMR